MEHWNTALEHQCTTGFDTGTSSLEHTGIYIYRCSSDARCLLSVSLMQISGTLESVPVAMLVRGI
jgi:hypothetical protein